MAQRINLVFPLSNSPQGYFAFNDTLINAVRTNVRMVLFTPKGTRIYRPDFGTNIQKYLFQPQDGTLKSGIQSEIRNALKRWIKNIRVDAVLTFFKDEIKNSQYTYVNIDDQSVFVIVQYTIVSGDGMIQIPNQTIGLTFSNTQ